MSFEKARVLVRVGGGHAIELKCRTEFILGAVTTCWLRRERIAEEHEQLPPAPRRYIKACAD